MQAFLQHGTPVRVGGQPDDTGGCILVAIGPVDSNNGPDCQHPSWVWTFLTESGSTVNLPARDVQATNQKSPWVVSISKTEPS